MEYIDVIVGGIVVLLFAIIVLYFWIPKRGHVFLRQMCRGFQPLVTGFTIITYKKADSVPWLSSWFAKSDLYIMVEIPIPNALILGSYLFCCVMAVILLP
jgi:hypothetical protein